MVEYLINNGLETRLIQAEAKRLELLPYCHPESLLIRCLLYNSVGSQDFSGSFALRRQPSLSGFGPGEAWALYLAPVAYGAIPMAAVLYILLSVIVFGIMYNMYSYASRNHDGSPIPGFTVIGEGRAHERISMFRYSMDLMIPLIDLKAYARMRPSNRPMQAVVLLQLVLGWWLVTAFLQTVVVP